MESEGSKHFLQNPIGPCNIPHVYYFNIKVKVSKGKFKGKGKVTPLQARCGPEGG
jgi:hypothetical protein